MQLSCNQRQNKKVTNLSTTTLGKVIPVVLNGVYTYKYLDNMKRSIKNTQSLTELREFLLAQNGLLEDKNSDFVSDLIHDWDERILSKKLIEFHEEELAKKIDAINPNQPKLDICNEIYQIISPKEDDDYSSYYYDDSYDSSNPLLDMVLGAPCGL